MKPSLNALLLGLALLVGGVLTGCNDQLSEVGEGIQPPQDKVSGTDTPLEFEATTISTPTLYSDATLSMLGEVVDGDRQTIRGEFIKGLQTAPQLNFSGPAEGRTIDSVRLMLYNVASEGDATAPIRYEVYELAQPLTSIGTTQASLSQYALPERRLGSAILSPDMGLYIDNASTVRALPITLDKSLGERIYQAWLNPVTRASYFGTQRAFEQNVLAGLYVRPATGRGHLMEIAQVALIVYYSYPDAADSTQRTRDLVSFIDTRTTLRINGVTNTAASQQTTTDEAYTYVKGPAGVTTQYTLSADKLQRLLQTAPRPRTDSIPASFFDEVWLLADANLALRVDTPQGVLLNTPDYLLLLPLDRKDSFFSDARQRIVAGETYLSAQYSAATGAYLFRNIAQIVTNHLRRYARYSSATGWTITEPLELAVVPVTVVTNGSNTISLQEQIFPSYIRFSRAAQDLRVNFVSVQLQQ